MATLTVRTRVAGALADVTAVILSDPAGEYGVREGDLGAIIVAAGAVMTRTAKGVYDYNIDLDEGMTYHWWARVLYAGEIHHMERRYFDESARNTDPGVAKVLAGVTYKIANVVKTGTAVPIIGSTIVPVMLKPIETRYGPAA